MSEEAPLDALERATIEYARAEDAVWDAIKTAVLAGEPMTDVAARSPWKEAWIRREGRRRGIPPARRGPRKKAEETGDE